MIIESIRAEISLRGWTQEELSRRTGLHQQAISRILTGERDCTTATADRLLLALNLVVTPRHAGRAGRKKWPISGRSGRSGRTL